jgi:excisionase family DNA binding protein
MRQLEQTPALEPAAGAADPDRKFSRTEAAEYLGISARTLEGWAVRGGGPRMLRLGSRVVYRRRDLEAWLATRERTSTTDRGPAA